MSNRDDFNSGQRRRATDDAKFAGNAAKLVEKAFALRKVEPSQSLELAKQAENEALTTGNLHVVAAAWTVQAEVLLSYDPARALPIARNAYDLSKQVDDQHGAGRAVLAMYSAYSALGQFAAGFPYLAEAFARGRAAGDLEMCAIAMLRMGESSDDRRDFSKALSHYDLATEWAETHGFPEIRLLAESGYVNALLHLNRHEDALQRAHKLCSLLTVETPWTSRQAVLTALAASQIATGALEQARQTLGNALAAGCRRIGERISVRLQLTRIRYYLANGEIERAIRLSRRKVDQAYAEDRVADALRFKQYLGRSLAASGDFEQAYRVLDSWRSENEQWFAERSQEAARTLNEIREMEILRAEAELERRRSVEMATVNQELRQVMAQKEKLQRQLVQMSSLDELTGIFNRRQFVNEAMLEFERFVHLDTTFSVLMIDVDHLKRINETYGHPVGDEVLRRVAKSINEKLRGTDMMGRLGGEEFGVLLPTANVGTATRVASRILEGVESTDLSDIIPEETITVSIGVCEVRNDHLSFFDVLSEADAALYEAKAWGRAQVQVYHPEIPAA